MPKTLFKIENTIKKGTATIYKVATEDYPYPTQKGYFIDSRFVKTSDDKPPGRSKQLPVKKAIIDALVSSEGGRYIWGGNYKEGIPQMISFYPPSPFLNNDFKEQWMLKGVDCSGLLYETTGGSTPRNTSSLITFGEPVKIAGLSASQIIQTL
ncbi:MAG: peptidoglycan endopeptidase, partial [Deltaproteobacteria bacterium]|nr:peptidoglycan endopeptidase [Deltaproteobacteria bacterium]